MFARTLAPILCAIALTGCASGSADDISTVGSVVPADQQAFLDTCKDWDEWNKPAPPYKIHANSYYVGTCGISAILITDEEGHVLIDTGTEQGAEVVARNIESLEFTLNNIQVITHSHEHFDHVGGLAKMVSRTGARVVASVGAVGPLKSGLSSPDDPQDGMHSPMEPVAVSAMIDNHDVIGDGSIALTAIATPGHTPGAMSWQWKSCDSADCKTVVYADSLSPVSSDIYRFSDHPRYVAEYRAGLQRLREVKCDILLTPHPSASKMLERAATGSLEGGMTCTEYADAIEKRLDARLTKEADNQVKGE